MQASSDVVSFPVRLLSSRNFKALFEVESEGFCVTQVQQLQQLQELGMLQ